MKASNPRIRSLLRQAKRTAGTGKRAAAQQLYREITEEAPELPEGWLGLAQTTRDPEARKSAYKRALALEPENEEALAGLEGNTLPSSDPAAATPMAPGEAPTQVPDDPFDQSRAWLDEATRRQPAPQAQQDGIVKKPKVEPELDPAGAEEQDVVGAPLAAGEPVSAGEDTEPALTCYRHPNRETGLRCYSCDRPICIKCAKRTPVGYRCPQCIREAEGVFYTANVLDYMLAGTVALILGLIAGFFVRFLGFFVIFIGPAAGSLIGRFSFRAARRRRGRWLAQLVAALVAIGGLVPTVLPLLPALLAGQVNLAELGFELLWPLLYVFLATGAAYYQVR